MSRSALNAVFDDAAVIGTAAGQRERAAARGQAPLLRLRRQDDAQQRADSSVSDELLRVNEALRELEALDPELAQVVEMRYFGGYSETEIAECQGVTERTVRRRWDKARAWLFVSPGGSAAQGLQER